MNIRRISILFFVLSLLFSNQYVYAGQIESPLVYEPQHIPILMYNHLMPEAERVINDAQNGTVISSEAFLEQMTYLYNNGWQTISTTQLYEHFTGAKQAPDKSFMITFDDGYYSNYSYAYPVLKVYNFTAVEFVITDHMHEIERLYDGRKMSWMDCKAIDDVFEIQSHSHYFHKLEDGIPYFSIKSEVHIQQDIEKSLVLIEENGLLRDIMAIAYPYGYYDEKVLAAVEANNLHLGFTTNVGYATKESKLLEVERFFVHPNMLMEDFIFIFDSLYQE